MYVFIIGIVVVVVVVAIVLSRTGGTPPGGSDAVGAGEARAASHHAQSVRDQGFGL